MSIIYSGEAWLLKKDGTEIIVENHPADSTDDEIVGFMLLHDSEAQRLISDEHASAPFAEVKAVLETLYEEMWCRVQFSGKFDEEATFHLQSPDESWYQAIVQFLLKHKELNLSSVTVLDGQNVMWDKQSYAFAVDKANEAELANRLKKQKPADGERKIYLTGDIHGSYDIHRLTAGAFPEQKEMTKDDFVIICGDFGLIWSNEPSSSENYWLKWLDSKPFTTLFVDGNHENHPRLNGYPVIDFHGGRAHKISDSIFHLMRGEIFTICENKFFAMGGAASHDRQYRREGISWWPGEMPSAEEYQNALKNLEAANWNVDYIISHCCADSIQAKISPYYEKDELTRFFEDILRKCTFKNWLFGHYHLNVSVDDIFICSYERIRRIV